MHDLQTRKVSTGLSAEFVNLKIDCYFSAPSVDGSPTFQFTILVWAQNPKRLTNLHCESKNLDPFDMQLLNCLRTNGFRGILKIFL